MSNFDELCPKDHSKGNGDYRIKRGSKTLLDSDYADNISILDENVSKINELTEVCEFIIQE